MIMLYCPFGEQDAHSCRLRSANNVALTTHTRDISSHDSEPQYDVVSCSEPDIELMVVGLFFRHPPLRYSTTIALHQSCRGVRDVCASLTWPKSNPIRASIRRHFADGLHLEYALTDRDPRSLMPLQAVNALGSRVFKSLLHKTHSSRAPAR